MRKACKGTLTWVGTLGAAAAVVAGAEYAVLAGFCRMVARGPLRRGLSAGLTAYFAENCLADFLFMAGVAGAAGWAAALAARFTPGKRPVVGAWALSAACTALAAVLFITPVNFYYVARVSRFLSAPNVLLNGGLALVFIAAAYPTYRLCKFYLARLARRKGVRIVQGLGAAAVAVSFLILAVPRLRAAEAVAANGVRPNVAIIVVDALRADALSCYGAPLPTPNVDRFAAGACRFENAFSCAPQTNRSVMTIFTSQYPTVHKARLDAGPSGEWETLAEVLSREGYDCRAAIGNDVLRPALGFARGFRDYDVVTEPGAVGLLGDTVFGGIYRRVFRKMADRGTKAGITELVTARTVSFLDGYDYARPFFLYVHYMDPHMPYTPPARYVRGEPALSSAALERLARDADFIDSYNDTPTEVLRTLYLGEVAYVDDRLAEVFAALERHGLYDDTLIVITADHGEMFREHGYLGHNTHYREVIRVPLIVRAPTGPLAEARRYDAAVSLADLAPTVYAFCGVTPPPALEGKDLAGFVAAPSPERFVFSETRTFDDEPKALHSVRYTIIEDREKGRLEIYDRAHDPDEMMNVYLLEPALSLELVGRITRTRLTVADKSELGGKAVAYEFDASETQRLKSLGYVGD